MPPFLLGRGKPAATSAFCSGAQAPPDFDLAMTQSRRLPKMRIYGFLYMTICRSYRGVTVNKIVSLFFNWM